MSQSTTGADLPPELFRSSYNNKIAHLDEDCRQVKNGGRWVDTEFLRRAGFRLCITCGDGGEL